MIYKLIILIASIFMIYEFTKARSTAVASIEPKANAWISIAMQGDKVPYATSQQIQQANLEYDKVYGNLANDMVGFKIPDLSWLKLNGV